ncbi:lysM and putative peptidoglycan-binding domain-containing protein 3-like [Diadema setosum]|uniref:lysM and putative peptidoglycan-binding domain-containing protein 3-like n=1 Tax=Diadema setosum TaxID=31175 RepID=UPI003B3A9114
MTSILGFRNKPKYDRHNYLPISGQVQNVQNSTVYIFGSADVAEDEIDTDADNLELSDLRVRGSGKQQKKTRAETVSEFEFVEKDIGEGDTLQTISLQYGCRVSELKRINNLIADQDFFALRKLKVPMRKDGLLLEKEREMLTQRVGLSQSANHTGPISPNSHRHLHNEEMYSDSDDSQTEFIRTISIPGSLDGKDKAAQEFFDKMDQDLHNILENTKTHKGSLEEVTSVLKETRFQPLAFPKSNSDCPSDGATLGCTFRNMIVAIVLIVIVVPLAGIVYYLNKDRL